jgi:hypothetical protein
MDKQTFGVMNLIILIKLYQGTDKNYHPVGRKSKKYASFQFIFFNFGFQIFK